MIQFNSMKLIIKSTGENEFSVNNSVLSVIIFNIKCGKLILQAKCQCPMKDHDFINQSVWSISFDRGEGGGQQCCYDKDGLLMMTSDNKWGGNPGRSHNLGMMPWNEAGKVRLFNSFASSI